MIRKSIFPFFLILFADILLLQINLSAQQDTSQTPIALISIEDSLGVTDSLSEKRPAKPFLVQFSRADRNRVPSTYGTAKKEIDFTDYKYSGNILNTLPFGYLNDLGGLGSPNEPILYGFGHGDISFSYNERFFRESWNSSFDMNKIQSESIGTFSVVPISRAFLLGFQNNPAAVDIAVNDTLKTKPISRIRYYQAPNEEGTIGALFSARVLPRLALTFRFTNNSIDENYTNTDYGAWKVNLKGIYKLGDSLFTSVDYHHYILKTPLNGGIDVNSMALSSTGEYDIYATTNPVVNSAMNNKSSGNIIAADIYGNILPAGFSKLTAEYSELTERFKYGLDTSRVRANNKQKALRTYFDYDLNYNLFSGYLNAGYEYMEYDLELLDYKKDLQNYFASASAELNLLDSLLIPSVYGKYSYFNEQSLSGFGADIRFNIWKHLQFFAGYSHFDKAYSIIERLDIKEGKDQIFNTYNAGLEFSGKKISASVSYFEARMQNKALPILKSSFASSDINEIFFETGDEISNKGVNFNAKINFWILQLSGNINYYFSSNSEYSSIDKILNARTGLYYIDTLFSSNLNLKTGLIFYYHDNPNFIVYDFARMRSASLSLNNNSIEALTSQPAINDKLRLDFYLAGRIQDTATFYLIYENLLGSSYYIVPYYPMPDGGIRIGISWDFLD